MADDDAFARRVRAFYEAHGIPWKRSFLFHGAPGAGKTSAIQAIAGRYGRKRFGALCECARLARVLVGGCEKDGQTFPDVSTLGELRQRRPEIRADWRVLHHWVD